MRAILRFFARFRFLLFFLVLEALAVVLTIRHNYYHQAAFFNSSNAISGGFYQKLNNFTAYLDLRRVNDSLVTYVSNLQSTLPQNQFSDSSSFASLTIDSTVAQRYFFTGARVINNTIEFRNNYLTLDKGSLAGIKPRTAVMTTNGVVGIVKDVSLHFSTVISLLNKNARISARLKKSGTAGTVLWSGGSFRSADLIEIPEHVEVEVGDSILTSPYSSIFPDGLFIGTISEVRLPEGSSMYEIKVKLGANFKQINYVWVIEDRMIGERDTLESSLTYD